jgi:hypothetical protein
MKRCAALLLLLAGCAFAQEAPAPKIEFQSVPDFFKLPQDMNFGEVAGVAVDSHKHIFVFSRGNTTGPAYGAAAAQLLEFFGNGRFFREIGHNLYGWSYAHSVKVDRNDNIWVADKGSDVVVEVQPRWPGCDGVRAQAGGIGRRDRSVEASASATACGGWNVSPGHRHCVGLDWQQLYQ